MTPGTLDFVLVAILGVAWPLYDHFVDWPMFLRWLREGRGAAFTWFAVTLFRAPGPS